MSQSFEGKPYTQARPHAEAQRTPVGLSSATGQEKDRWSLDPFCLFG